MFDVEEKKNAGEEQEDLKKVRSSTLMRRESQELAGSRVIYKKKEE